VLEERLEKRHTLTMFLTAKINMWNSKIESYFVEYAFDVQGSGVRTGGITSNEVTTN
jgi:hypothetical protein